MLTLPKPYMLFLGNVKSLDKAKTATGIFNFCPDDCHAEYTMQDCEISFGLKQVSFTEAKSLGIKSLVIGIANAGGYIDEQWLPAIKQAITSGLHIISGLHHKLNDNIELSTLATKHNVRLIDIRRHDPKLTVCKGQPRTGKRILTVGTDCNIGKMYTSLKLHSELKKQGFKSSFRATGQTGIIISGSGIAVDAVISDFISGAVESITPSHDNNHFDIIEGQGSIFHPSYSGVSLGLLHGSQPDYLILCHEPTRTHMRHCDIPIADLNHAISLHIELAKLMNNKVKFLGISLNLSQVHDTKAQNLIKERISNETGLVVIDPNLDGVGALIKNLN